MNRQPAQPQIPGLTNQQQLQRITLERTFFWHGVLSLNENGGHTFFDVRLKKQVKGAPAMIGLYTNDIPPFPLTATDTLTCELMLENNMGYQTQRNEIVKVTLPGSELFRTLEEREGDYDQVVVMNDTGEWQFQQMEKKWVLRAIVLYVQQAALKELVKDL